MMKIIGEHPVGPGGEQLPFSQAVEENDLVFVSGQVAMRDGEIHGAGIAEQFAVVMDNIATVLGGEDLDLDHVVKVTIWITHAALFAELNTAFAARFRPFYPARSTVVSGLVVAGALVEVEAVASRRARRPLAQHPPMQHIGKG